MSSEIYQLHVSLKSLKPLKWRRILVESDIKLSDLHEVIQVIGGWNNSHLYQFEKDGDIYMPLDDGNDYGLFLDVEKMQLKSLMEKEKDKLDYIYDLGDSWNHIILLEKILPFDEKKKYPTCITGKKNFPQEDGGGYSDEFDSDCEDDNGPIKKRYDPNYFNKDEINARLHTLFD